MAAISSPDPRTLVIQPWDGSLLKAIEKAIQTSDLGINPQNDGRVIRLAFPQLTEERRKDLTRQVRKYGEEGKVALRNIRRDAMDEIKKKTKKSELTEDDQNLDLDILNSVIIDTAWGERACYRCAYSGPYGEMILYVGIDNRIIYQGDVDLANADYDVVMKLESSSSVF